MENDYLWLKHELDVTRQSQHELQELMFNDSMTTKGGQLTKGIRTGLLTQNDDDNNDNNNNQLGMSSLYGYESWDWLGCFEWILSLRNGKFSRYSRALFTSLKQGNIDGLMLSTLTENDINSMGITDFNHRFELIQDIKKLVNIDTAAIPDNDDGNNLKAFQKIDEIQEMEGDIFKMNTFENIEGGIYV